MLLSRRTLALAAAAGALLSGCRHNDVVTVPEGVDPSWSLRPAFVDIERNSVQAIVSPMTARVGVPFTLTINSYGSSSCTRLGNDQVETRGMVADITVLNWEAPDGSPCTRDIRFLPHEIALRFTQAGDATVRVRARSPRTQELFTYDMTLRVEP
ncbi:MAG TPA: hypothetical protein VKA84_04895 [Gemmatimonadaceae bacterium]|nr:hypothetical protein [Gemmatimonadaceae bacterium]